MTPIELEFQLILEVKNGGWTPLFYGCLDIAIVNACINWKETKGVDISFHDFVVAIIEEIQPPIRWWDTSMSGQDSVEKVPTNLPIVKEYLIHEPFMVKGSRKVDVRKNCVMCKKKTNVGCKSCKKFVCFETCWKGYHNQ